MMDSGASVGTMPPGTPQESAVDGWRILHYGEVDSTNLVASGLPAWSAVMADTQTRGRGRFQRSWVSDKGGLWLSAVVPVDDQSPESKLLPLIAGLAVIEVCSNLGVQGARMRWPNDVLIGNRKLAGLLVDQFKPGRAVVGIGINVNNQPETCDPGLAQQTTRLADLVGTLPDLTGLSALLLNQLRHALIEASAAGFETLLPRINGLWDSTRRVTVELDESESKMEGRFAGVDEAGRLRLSDEAGGERFFEAHQVKLLREV